MNSTSNNFDVESHNEDIDDYFKLSDWFKNN
jgi:hypothetical protein